MANESTVRDNIRRDLKESTTLPFSFKQFVSGMASSISRASRNTWDKISDVPDELRNGFSKISGTIQSSTTEIMGSALNNMLNDIKSLASGIKDITVGTFSKLFSFFGSDEDDEQLDQEKKQTKTLGNIFKIFKSWNTRDLLKWKKKDSSEDGGIFTPLAILGLALGAIVGGVAASIGGVIKYFTIPFEATLKALSGITTMLRESVLFKKIVDFFGKIRAFFGGWVDNALLTITNFFGKFKIFAGFFKGFGIGFMKVFSKVPVIGWFITGVMAVIDFFEGFFGKDGSFFEKLKAGIINMTTGFFNPIFEFVGWITDWVLGLFGIEADTGKYLKDKFSLFLNGFFDFFTVFLPGIVGKVWDQIVSLKDWVINYPIKDKLNEMWENVKTAAENLVDSIKKWVMSLIPTFDNLKQMLPTRDSIKESVIGVKDKAINKVSSWWDSAKESASNLLGKSTESPSATVSDLDASSRSKELAKDNEMIKSLARMEERAKQEAKKREEEARKEKPVNQQVNVSSIQNVRGSGSSGGFVEAPDEIENFGIVFMNKTTLGGLL